MKFLLVLLVTLFIVGCGNDAPVDKSNAQPVQVPTLLNTQLDALEKAKEVEQSLQKMTEAREEEMRQKGI